MARLYARADGRLCGWFPTEEMAAQLPPPPDAAESLTLDEDANAALLAALNATGFDAYRLSRGVLTKDGQPVTISPPAADPRQALIDTILSRPAIASDPVLRDALAAFLGAV